MGEKKLTAPVSVTGLKYVTLSLEAFSEIIGRKVVAPWAGTAPSWVNGVLTVPVIVEE